MYFEVVCCWWLMFVTNLMGGAEVSPPVPLMGTDLNVPELQVTTTKTILLQLPLRLIKSR